MAADTGRESIESIAARLGKKAEAVSERVNANRAQRRAEAREQRLFDKRKRQKMEAKAASTPVISEDPRERTLTQDRVDTMRAEVTMRTLINVFRRNEDYKEFPQQYLWFPRDDIAAVEIRYGNPPADQDRPKHLQRLHLVLDYQNAPQPLVELCRQAGKKLSGMHRVSRGKDPIRETLEDNHLLAQMMKHKYGIKHG
jgi:hypothetical protein